MKYAVRAKILLAITVFALLTVSAVFLINNPGLISPAPSAAKPQVRLDQAEVVIDGFKFAKNDGMGENWQLTARKALMQKASGQADLTDLEAVYNAKNGVVLKLTADNGTYDSKAKRMKAIGKDKDEVVVTSSNGYRMTSPTLAWDGVKQELSTKDNVTLSGKNIKIEGKGMVARSDLQEVKITNGVKTTFTQSR
ncbi:MAG: LPS export ABC transporter periplasmic protein LptC [Nitrospirota bacterium]